MDQYSLYVSENEFTFIVACILYYCIVAVFASVYLNLGLVADIFGA